MVNFGGGSGSSTAAPQIPQDLMGLRSSIGDYFKNQLSTYGPSYNTSPQGAVGSAYNALFSKNPQEDWLGAKGAIERGLNGQGLQQGAQQIFQGMLPSVMSGIKLGGAALGEQAGLNGLRFSTSLLGQQRNLANQQLMGLQNTAYQNAAGYNQAQMGMAHSLMQLIGQLGDSQLARQLPLLIQYAQGFAPVGNNSSNSSFNLGAG